MTTTNKSDDERRGRIPRLYTAPPRKHPRTHPDWPCERVRKVRESKGHDRDAMAACIGVSVRTIYRWELGEVPADDARMRLYEMGKP